MSTLKVDTVISEEEDLCKVNVQSVVTGFTVLSAAIPHFRDLEHVKTVTSGIPANFLEYQDNTWIIQKDTPTYFEGLSFVSLVGLSESREDGFTMKEASDLLEQEIERVINDRIKQLEYENLDWTQVGEESWDVF